MAVVSTAASVVTEYQSAKNQNKAISDQLAQGQKQVAQQESSQLNERAREARKEQGRMMVAAGEAGLQLSSGSIEAMLLDSAMQQKLADANIGQNAENQSADQTAEANRYYSQVQAPSVIGAGLRLVSSGVQGYAAGRAATIGKQAASSAAAKQVAGR